MERKFAQNWLSTALSKMTNTMLLLAFVRITE